MDAIEAGLGEAARAIAGARALSGRSSGPVDSAPTLASAATIPIDSNEVVARSDGTALP